MINSFHIAIVLYLDLYTTYFNQKSIGNRLHSDKFKEALKTLQIYIMLLEYHEGDNTFLEAEDIKNIYQNFTQVHYSIKSLVHE